MSKNMSMMDRLLRTLLIAPVAVVIGIVIGPGSIGSIVLYVVAAVMLATSTVGYCPLYSVFGVGGHREQQAH